MKIKHNKGCHYSTPILSRLEFGINSIEETYYFDDNAKYDISKREKKDWNKLVGLSLNLFSAQQNSMMIGWRYNEDLNLFEFAPYQHDNKRVIKDSSWVTLPEGEVNIFIKAHKDNWEVRINKVIDFSPKLDKSLTGRKILSWFGGQETPNKDIYFELLKSKTN